MNIDVYTTPACGYCHQVKEFLSQRGVKFKEYDVSVNRADADEMVRKSGQTGVPVIIVDGQVVVGFDHARLEQLLSNSNNGHRPYFGLHVADAIKVARRFGHAPVKGAYVGKVVPYSLGEKASLRPGDIITEVNSLPIENADDLEKVLSALTVGHQVVIALLREQRNLKFEITI